MLSYRGNPPVTARHGRADCLDWVSDERTAPLLRAGVSASGAGRGCPVARHSHRPPTDRELAATHPRPTPRPTTACLAHVNLKAPAAADAIFADATHGTRRRHRDGHRAGQYARGGCMAGHALWRGTRARATGGCLR